MLQVSSIVQTVDFFELLINAVVMKEQSAHLKTWLIADIGATSSRCAIFRASDQESQALEFYANDDFSSPGDLLQRYIDSLSERPEYCALAIAAPIHGDDVEMINRNWRFNRDDLCAVLGVKQVLFFNDFHANALSLPSMDNSMRIEIGSATEYRDNSMAVLGPGSGLGMAAWIGNQASGRAMFGEGGHITIAGRNKDEDKIISALRDRYRHCSAERILSGPGLIALHKVMHNIDVETSESITLRHQDTKCAQTMEQFYLFLASAAADLALITGAFGGVYIAGGIVPACVEGIGKSGFRSRFEDKNRYRDYMQRIPTYVITDPVPALRGLSNFITKNQGKEWGQSTLMK